MPSDEPRTRARTTLAVETAFPTVSVALRTDRGVFEPRIDMSRARAAALQAAVADLFEQAELEAADVDEILVDVGPGSYTGLRVGLAMVRTFALLVPVEIRALFAPDLVAMRARDFLGEGREFAVVADARRGQWFVTRYRFEGPTLIRVADPRCVARDAFVTEIEEIGIAVSATDEIPVECRQAQVGCPDARELYGVEELAFAEPTPAPRYLMPPI